MNAQDEADLRLLQLANEKGKFALSIGTIPDMNLQLAFERGIDQHWFMFVDIGPLAHGGGPELFRIFKLTQNGFARRDALNTDRVSKQEAKCANPG